MICHKSRSELYCAVETAVKRIFRLLLKFFGEPAPASLAAGESRSSDRHWYQRRLCGSSHTLVSKIGVVAYHHPMSSIVLIPGLLCNEDLWSSQAAVLGRRGDIVVADLSTQATVFEMASAVLEAAPEHFSLAGFSLGSQVALEIMSIAGERVERLALLSATHGGLLPPVEKAIGHAIEIIEGGNFDGYLEAAYPSYVSASRISDPVVKRCFMDMAHAVGKDAGLRQMRALLQIKTPFSSLGQIRCPALIIGGRNDRRTTPAAHQALAKEIPGSQLVMIEDAAHFTLLEQPSVVAEWMERWISTG